MSLESLAAKQARDIEAARKTMHGVLIESWRYRHAVTEFRIRCAKLGARVVSVHFEELQVQCMPEDRKTIEAHALELGIITP